MRLTHVITGTLWLGVYLTLALAPLGFVLLTGSRAGPAGRDFWTEFSVGLGFVGLAMMGLQFVLTARFRWLKSPYGSDVIYAFHRVISIISVAFILMHPAILFVTRWEAMKQRPFTHPWPFWLGTFAVLCLVVIIVVSVWRQRLKIHYDAWRRGHAILAVAAIAAGIAHVLLVGHYLAEPWQRGLWLLYTLAWVGLIVYVRVAKPAMEMGSPWQVAEVKPQLGNAWTLALEPKGHDGFAFMPGQFAWITLRDSPFSDREHPFSFSGSAAANREHPRRVEFTIKELGDWTSRVKETKPGDTAYVDGPFGALSADRHPDAQAFAFFAGGIGITPMISHLRTFADRGEPRPCWLFYAAKDWESLTLRDEVLALRERLPSLHVVVVLNVPPAAGPSGVAVATGFITPELMRERAPELVRLIDEGRRVECFICGPTPMMEAIERHLHALGVPLGDFHSERFNLV